MEGTGVVSYLFIHVPRAFKAGLKKGDSVSVDGVCLTVHRRVARGIRVEVMHQTLALTTLGELTEGARVNLERSLHIGDELGGHFVYGHVDGVGTIMNIGREGEATLMKIKAPDHLMPSILPQGAIAVDGVSLTVAKTYDDHLFKISLLDQTLRATTLSDKRIGDHVNLEVDMLVKAFIESKHLYGENKSI